VKNRFSRCGDGISSVKNRFSRCGDGISTVKNRFSRCGDGVSTVKNRFSRCGDGISTVKNRFSRGEVGDSKREDGFRGARGAGNSIKPRGVSPRNTFREITASARSVRQSVGYR